MIPLVVTRDIAKALIGVYKLRNPIPNTPARGKVPEQEDVTGPLIVIRVPNQLPYRDTMFQAIVTIDCYLPLNTPNGVAEVEKLRNEAFKFLASLSHEDLPEGTSLHEVSLNSASSGLEPDLEIPWGHLNLDVTYYGDRLSK